MSDRLVRFARDSWQEIEALPQSVRRTVQRAAVHLPDAESRQRIGLAAEIRIGLDLGEAPAYFDLLSFLPPAEYSALLSAAGFSGRRPAGKT